MEMISKQISMFLVVVLLFFGRLPAEVDNGLTNHNSSRSSGGGGDDNEMKVGVIVDLGSWTGHNILNCIQTAVTDFYASQTTDSGEGKRGIVLHIRDSRGDPMHALSAAVDLLESVKVQAILGPESYLEPKLLALLADKAKTPIFTFSSLFSSYEIHPFLVQIRPDQIFLFKGLANVLTFFEWNMVNIVYEDSDYGRECLPFLIESLEEERVHVAHKIAISGIYTDYEIVSMLDHLTTSQATINIVHVSTITIIDRLFLFVKRMGIMKAGYVWIITEYNMNTLDDKVLVDSLQADVIGIKAHIPASSKLKEFTIRWRKGFKEKGQKMEVARQPCSSCILAYDTLWALADFLERVEKQPWKALEGSLLSEMGKTSFAGLSGEFRILNGKIHSTESYEIINVNSKGEKIVGYWTRKHGLIKEAQVDDEQLEVGVPRRGLQDVAVWPKGRVGIPPRGLLGGGKKLRIGVVINPGFPELVDFYLDPLSASKRFKGYCIEVFEAAISSLDYAIAYDLILYENTGSYGQMIDQVYAGVFDSIVGDVTITANRSLYLDFTMPYTDLGVGTIARRNSGDMWVFTRPLNGNLWLMSSILFTLIGVVVWIIEHPDNEEFQGSISKQVGTILSFGFSTLVYAHREKLISNLSKFVVNVWLFVVLILTSSYTATLSSMLTIRQIQLASVDNIGIQSGDPLLSGAIIMNNVNFTYNQIQLYNSPKEYADALAEGSKKGGVTAIIDEIPYIKIFLGKYGRDYSMIASASTTAGFGFGFRKGQPRLVSDMSRAILEMREEGRLAMLEELWFKKKLSSFLPDDEATTPNALDLTSFSGLFIIISISIAIALIVHLTFMLVKRVQANNLVEKVIFGGYFAFFLSFLAPRNKNVVELSIM